jgi:hypothetical protein
VDYLDKKEEIYQNTLKSLESNRVLLQNLKRKKENLELQILNLEVKIRNQEKVIG